MTGGQAATTLLRTLQGQLDEYLADLRSLVEVDCGSHDKAGVDEVGRRFASVLRRCGFDVEILPVDALGDCLRGRVRGVGRGRLLLLGHLDTVYPDGTAAERPMRIRDGRVLGPGVNDMKAGLLAGAYAVRAMLATGFEAFEEITFFCNGDEEIGSRASAVLYRPDALAADAAFVLEAARADGSIVSERKGGGRFRLTVSGRSAHAGVEPERGANAILEAAHRIVALSEVSGLRPGVTVSVGRVEGGTTANVVPDLAWAELDVRVARIEDVGPVERALLDAVRGEGVPGTSARLAGRIALPPMVKTDASAALVRAAQEIAGQLGFALAETSTGGMSDANRIAALGRPVLDGLGPVGGLDHGPDEYVELSSIVPRTALLAGLIRATLIDLPSAGR